MTGYLDVLADHARHAPNAPALIDPVGEYTYAELWTAVEEHAAALRALGVVPGDRVVTALAPGAPHLAALFGVMAAGAVAVPLNIRLARPEAYAFLAPLRPAQLLAAVPDTELAARLGCGLATLPSAGTSGSLTDRMSLTVVTPASSSPEFRDETAAMIIGTGGTTGEPKGATWTHSALYQYAASCQAQMDIRRTDVELYFSPFFHIAVATIVFSTLFAGGTAWLLPRFDEAAVLDALATGRPTRLFGAPTALVRLLEHPGFGAEHGASIRRVLFGSTASVPAFPGRLRAAFPQAHLITGYGATEFGAVARLRSWEQEDGVDRGLGRPVPGASIRIVDDAGHDVPRGSVGEVVVRAPWQMSGYWARPEQTHATVVDGAIRSGDLGRLDEDGFLHLAGRAKDMIISGGENVFPIEVENVIARHPQVHQVAVFGVDDPLWGERVEAAVVPHPGSGVDFEGVREHCRAALAGYKVPRRFHVLDALPVTPAMKVDKRALREVTRDA
ncbi:class I adenylate-forming enzyme family protein [Micromonospora sp. RTGN7]|uniref:class I adenylate-forming enzyme family protein n=1 Tax=Micromonospora sp. RTGN7 TaxID=3016526 RepID=UPI0029FEF600|nr:class I adenylate-forming enzyme family protein [Micromonospora sp. RTGN7]